MRLKLTFILTLFAGWTAFAAAPRLSVFHEHLATWAKQKGVPIAEVVQNVRTLGVTGIDAMNVEDAASVEAAIAAGLEVSRYVVFTDFAKNDSAAAVSNAFDFCARHGVKAIMLVPGYFHTNEMTKAEAWTAMKPRLAAFVDAAAKRGITVDLEDFDWFETVIGSEADLRLAFAAVPALGHVLDTGNYAYWGDDVLDALRAFRPRIRHVHVKDRSAADPRKSVPAGTGTMPIAEIVRRLRTTGYDGWWTVECFASDDYARDVSASVAYLKKLFAVTSVRTRESPDAVRMLGRTGELFRSSLSNRVYSAHARGPVYDEAEHAFATHWDDADGRTGWQNEYWGKTMLCYAGAIASTRDPELKTWCLDKAHRFIDAYQWTNGYLSTYAHEDLLRLNPESDDYEQHWCFNIWGRKYTLWALIELYRATGDAQCLKAAEKMADHLVAQLKRLDVPIEKTGSWAGISSMSILRPLLELHRLVPKPEYRALADHIIRVNDVRAGVKPDVNLSYDALSDRPVATWFRKPMFLAKAYELLSFFEGVADYHRLTGDRRALDATIAFWDHLEREELNPMRSAGYFDHFLSAKHHVNGMTELCDVTHWIRLSRELWLLTGETKYLDAIEEAFYNAFLAGVSKDGSWAAHIVRSHGTRHLAAPAQTGMKLHQCCPDNMLRTFYDWADTVAAVACDGAWELNFYSDADVSLLGVRLAIRGDYPVSERFTVAVEAEMPGRLRFRVPYWAETLSVDGLEMKPVAGRVEVAVPAGKKTFALALAMRPRVLASEAPGVEDIDTVTPLDTMKPLGYTKFFMTWYTPEMTNLVRRTPAATVMRGPLVLAKGRAAGTTREETFNAFTVNGKEGWRCSSAPLEPSPFDTWGRWMLQFEKGNVKRTVPVADFWSVSRGDDPTNWFSLWF